MHIAKVRVDHSRLEELLTKPFLTEDEAREAVALSLSMGVAFLVYMEERSRNPEAPVSLDEIHHLTTVVDDNIKNMCRNIMRASILHIAPPALDNPEGAA